MKSTQTWVASEGVTDPQQPLLNRVIFGELMRVRGIPSMARLAELAGVSKSTAFRVRDGETRALLSTAQAFARVLDTTVSTLFPEPSDV
ncbi:hypothetical protein Rhe02_55350 [Rhizocola hellebori]|uniref:HTH cro/C1-type domain-containing protein n=1 Tax=Rhizocola hellebori TaxID=1392758 RepID=A0A8J3VIZ3_9ACTN|nr:helix-turn-helix transcriptional regulator [Rhizocola hellebori]GIH07468.1 hypothetical protein Rhe02_55350 [Rhizocola hellebori]